MVGAGLAVPAEAQVTDAGDTALPPSPFMSAQDALTRDSVAVEPAPAHQRPQLPWTPARWSIARGGSDVRVAGRTQG
jgi:hypothetical protein